MCEEGHLLRDSITLELRVKPTLCEHCKSVVFDPFRTSTAQFIALR